jgi:pimeloyl-ACP methyl ester carboxylesterase
MGRLESCWVVANGLRMHACVSAEPGPAGAPPVVLVHGVGLSHRYLLPTAERLAPCCPVYVPDLPGFGKSAKPRRALGLAELTDALAAWMPAVGLERAVLLGNSFGCQIIADLAMRHPARIEATVLVGPTIDPHARTALGQIRRWLRNTPGEAPSQGLVIARDYWDCGLRRLVRTFRYALEDRIEDKLPLVRVPALVVRGSRDTIVPQCWAQEVTGLLPKGRLIVIPGAAHTLVYKVPAELVRAIRPFLDEVRQLRAEPLR